MKPTVKVSTGKHMCDMFPTKNGLKQDIFITITLKHTNSKAQENQARGTSASGI
jgi:hypothetical protein